MRRFNAGSFLRVFEDELTLFRLDGDRFSGQDLARDQFPRERRLQELDHRPLERPCTEGGVVTAFADRFLRFGRHIKRDLLIAEPRREPRQLNVDDLTIHFFEGKMLHSHQEGL